MSAEPALATLPMYDWPELTRDTDALWQSLRASLQDNGFPAPAALTRDIAPETLWHDGNLLLGQTCGLPFACDLSDTTALVGTPAYDIECGAGSYYSAIVVRTDSAFQSIGDLAGTRLAYNSRRSQSGYFALSYALSHHWPDRTPFRSSLCTGSHRESIRAVATAEADVAAIDGVSWEIARRCEPTSRRLRVLTQTSPTPGLPFISAPRWRRHADRLHMAVIEAMASLDNGARQNLLLTGFAHTQPRDYQVIRQRFELTKHVIL